MLKESLLVIVPLATILIIMGTVMKNSEQFSSQRIRTTLTLIAESFPSNTENTAVQKSLGKVDVRPPQQIDMTTDDCSCPSGYSESPCSVEGDAVMGGLDFVQYFTTFKNEDGTYNESRVGSVGDSHISSTYEGFKYNFLSTENKALFDASPESYIPQWGGFCSYGVSEEGCPRYAWAADCLGPSGNYGHWTIQNEKLYFFLFSDAKTKFMENVNAFIVDGDERWNDWFGEKAYGYMSTHCFVAILGDDDK